LILALADGTAYAALRTRFAVSDPTIARWRQRFVTQRVAGLRDRPRDGRGDRLAPAVEAKILALTQQPPPKPYTHWTTRRLAARLRLSHMTVHRVWQRAGLKPHRFGRYVASTDPDFEAKAADIIGLYLDPPAHAAVFCVDEKTAIQALDRRDPVLPMSPGRAVRHGFEYVRHGTLSLYAALETQTGAVLGKTAASTDVRAQDRSPLGLPRGRPPFHGPAVAVPTLPRACSTPPPQPPRRFSMRGLGTSLCRLGSARGSPCR